MKYIAIAILTVGFAICAPAQRISGPVDTRKLEGVVNYVQDEVLRDKQLVFLTTNLQPVFIITNVWEGTYAVMQTNAGLSDAFTIALPNPTNNWNRMFRFITGDAAHIVLSNQWSSGFTDLKTYGVSNVVWLVTSNKVTDVYSTRTNWAVSVR